MHTPWSNFTPGGCISASHLEDNECSKWLSFSGYSIGVNRASWTNPRSLAGNIYNYNLINISFFRFSIGEMTPLTAAEIYEHPEFETVHWDLKPAKKGRATVAQGRKGGPLKLAYEIHGEGPIKLVCIIGLGAFISGWQRQTKDFGHSQNTNRGQSPKYSVLVFDNRGMGDSDKPLSRYSTLEMAKDTLDLVDHVGWTSVRQLHVIGSSMGGMIAQEMACMAPQRVASLILIATGPRLFNTIGWVQNLRQRINLIIPRDLDVQLTDQKDNMFSSAWLTEPDAEGHFPTNGDRYAAQELMKRKSVNGYTRKGFLLQAIAAGWHHKSAQQLQELGDKVGRERILVIHGTVDRMITFAHGKLLAEELGGSEKGVSFIAVEGKGHALQIEWRRGLTKAVSSLIEKSETVRKS